MASLSSRSEGLLVLFAASLCLFLAGSRSNCMGIFTPYFIEEFQGTRFQIAWIGSLTNGLSFIFTVLSAVIFEQVGIAPAVGIASILFAGSVLAVSLVTKLWLAFILFSVAGCCEAVILLGGICFVSQYFERSRQTVLAIIMFVAGCGGLAGSFAFKELLHSFGLRVTLIFLAAIALPVIGSAFVFHIYKPSKLSEPPKEDGGIFAVLELAIINSKMVSIVSSCPEKKEVFPHCVFGLDLMDQKMEERSSDVREVVVSGLREYAMLLRDPRLILFLAAWMLVNFSNSINLLLLSDMVSDVFALTANEASYTFVALAMGSLLGRITAIGLSFVEYNRMSSVAGQMSIHAVLIMLYTMSTYETVCVLTALFGFSHGYTTSVATQFIIDTFGLKGLPKYVALAYLVKGVGALLGGPMAGAVKDAFSYTEALYFGGGVLLIGCALLFATTYHPQTRAFRAKIRDDMCKDKSENGGKISEETSDSSD